MAATSDALFSHYKIEDLNPQQWPAEKDEDSDAEDAINRESQATDQAKTRAKAQDKALDKLKRTSVPGAERSKDGVETLVERDEPDPLGTPTSVMQVLQGKGIKSLDADSKLRNRFLLSSTTFSPHLFLSEIHHDASTDDLIKGLAFLSQSIEKKSASLKVLVESNFDKFVRAKATIDNVYREMVNAGQDGPDASASARRTQSRQSGRPSDQFRKLSIVQSSSAVSGMQQFEKRKNALVKEQDYGVLPIRVPLLELKVKVDDIWGPALNRREREDQLKVFMATTEKQKSVFEIGANIAESIKRRAYGALVRDYSKAKKLADDARAIADNSLSSSNMSDADVLQLVSTARMWYDVEDQIEQLQKDVWRRLTSCYYSQSSITDVNNADQHMGLIAILLELGVEENPIWVWLLSRSEYLKQRITVTFERSKVEIEMLRRKLAQSTGPAASQLANCLRATTADGRVTCEAQLDSTKIIGMWDHVWNCLDGLLSTTGGILGQVLDFWETAQSFINGKAQHNLPVGIDGASRKHHRLSSDQIKSLVCVAQDLLALMRQNLLSLFVEPPIEDLSSLISPTSTTPSSPLTPKTPKTPKPANLAGFNDARLGLDVSDIPPPSPRRGNTWETYAFWPPYANSLSGTYYLGKILLLIASAACHMTGLITQEDNVAAIDPLKLLVDSCRERCLQAACLAWRTDCESVQGLEDWTRSQDRPDLTNLPLRLMTFQAFVLCHMQKILFFSDVVRKSATSADVVTAPSATLIQIVCGQFVDCMHKTIDGLKDNAEAPSQIPNDGADELTLTAHNSSSLDTSNPIDASNKNLRLLLTLSNIQTLRNDIIPHLTTTFETNFSVMLVDETSELLQAITTVDQHLFQAYVAPMIAETDAFMKAAIMVPDRNPAAHLADQAPPTTWAPINDVRPYVYQVLLSLVVVHTEISTTAAPLTSPILKHLLEKYLVSLLEAFRQRPRYSLSALMQATLDVEFMAQTLSNYTTDKASDTQGRIYILLDKLTDNEARLQLQKGLQELRSTLKRLREATKVEL